MWISPKPTRNVHVVLVLTVPVVQNMTMVFVNSVLVSYDPTAEKLLLS